MAEWVDARSGPLDTVPRALHLLSQGHGRTLLHSGNQGAERQEPRPGGCRGARGAGLASGPDLCSALRPERLTPGQQPARSGCCPSEGWGSDLGEEPQPRHHLSSGFPQSCCRSVSHTAGLRWAWTLHRTKETAKRERNWTPASGGEGLPVRAPNPGVTNRKSTWLLPGSPKTPPCRARRTHPAMAPAPRSRAHLGDVVHTLLEGVQDDILQHGHGLLAGRERAGEQGLLRACSDSGTGVTNGKSGASVCAHAGTFQNTETSAQLSPECTGPTVPS